MDISKVRDVIRVGRVSSVNGTNCTARVTFPDKDDLVSQELPIVTIGSNGTLGYWVPEVDTQVLCVFLPNPSGKGMMDLSSGLFIARQILRRNPTRKSAV